MPKFDPRGGTPPKKQALLKPALGRTQLAVEKNPNIISEGNQKGVEINKEFIPMVTRGTREFNKKLCSVGASSDREILILDPQEPIFGLLYNILKEKLKNGSDVLSILQIVMDTTRECFVDDKPKKFIERKMDNNGPYVLLSDLMKEQQGVCRHHALLNAYFVSRLVKDEILSGRVIHHRQQLGDKGVHNWNVFQNNEDGKVYSFDSLWNYAICLADPPSKAKIQAKYLGCDVKADILKMHFTPAINKIEYIKSKIESQNFVLGNYLFFKGGQTLPKSGKRVPHRVHDIYEAIMKAPTYQTDQKAAEALWKEIQGIAEDAIKNPRRGRHAGTTQFYQDIKNDLFDIKIDNEAKACDFDSLKNLQ